MTGLLSLRRLGVVCAAVVAASCAAEEPPASAAKAEAPDRIDWTLVALDGEPVVLPEWESGRRGEILAWQQGSVIQFSAGCGFSVSTHRNPPVVRGASPVSRKCSADDLAALEKVERLFADEVELRVVADQLTLTNSSGSSAVFEREPQVLVLD